MGNKPSAPVVVDEPVDPTQFYAMLSTLTAVSFVVLLSLGKGGIKGSLGSLLLHTLGLLLIVIDLALWVITLGPLKTIVKHMQARSVFAAPVRDEPINGAGMAPSKVWRSVEAIAMGKLGTTPYAECSTTWQALQRAFKKYADYPAQGTRPLLGWQKDEGFKFPAKVFGPTVWTTYGQLDEKAIALGAALRILGAKPQPADCAASDHEGVLIYDETAAEWMACAIGAMSQDIAVATAYATLGVDAVVKAVVQGAVTVLVCNRKAVQSVLSYKGASEMKSLKAIVYTDALCSPDDCKQAPPEPPAGIRLLSLDEAVALGKSKPAKVNEPKPSSVAVIMYTSGSTGDPKGVMVTQANLLAMISGVKVQMGANLTEGGETYLGYLPLAHILELSAEFFYLSSGNKIGYADPKTLLGGPEKAYPHGGLEEFKPSLMCGVPKVWEAIKAGALAKVKKAGPLAQFLISTAVAQKAWAAKQRRTTPLFNVLLKKFKATVGGRLKICLSGGGAISGEVQEWVRTALDCPLVQGYGLTETCAGATIQMPDDVSIGIAGTPLSTIEIALHSEPDITDANGTPYLATDKVHSDGRPCDGRGEVWLKGSNVTAGYYKLPEQTASEFDADGFFHTGDIGMLTPGGALVIIDRKKNLVKLKGGEYVALEKMNTAYNNSPYVNVEGGGVCCYAADSLDRAVCLAQIKLDMLEKAATEAGVPFDAAKPDAACADGKVQDVILKSFKAEAGKAGLTTLETVVGVYPIVDEWSTANGCLTATQKLVPKGVQKHQAKELDIIKKKGCR